MAKSKAVADWEALVREQGCIITGETLVQLHHVGGRTYRHNKQLVGPWYILPLSPTLHDVGSNHPHNVTHWRKRFEQAYGKQRDLFVNLCDQIVSNGKILPFSHEVFEAIKVSPK